jgi:Transglycosylase SLT domain/Putative peptidoglycan binding domain
VRYPVRIALLVAASAACLTWGGGVALAAPSPQVAGLQVALVHEGAYAGQIDAVLGPQTEAAVRRFQATAGLAVDGVAGPQTRHALGRFGRPLFGTRTIQKGMAGWDVAVLQYLLVGNHLLAGRPDGAFGPLTRAAVVRYQRAHGLVPDGVVGPATAAALCPTPSCAWTGGEVVSKASVRALLDHWADAYGVDRHLVRGIAWQESGYQPQMVSRQGAVGVMQITPETWTFVEGTLIGRPVAPTVEGNIRVGVAYVRYLLQLFGGDTVKAVAAYYQGPASVSVEGVLPPTQVYVDDVLALSQRL